MKSKVYAVTCITNLHMGSGDANFSVVDNEVQRDPVTNLPTMFSSGIKGALRDHFEACAPDKVTRIFGSSLGASRKDDRSGSEPGALKFLAGNLLLLPVRAAKGPFTYFLVTTRQILLDWASLYRTFTGKELAPGIEKKLAAMDGKKAYLHAKGVEQVSEEIRIEQQRYKKGILQALDADVAKALGRLIPEDKLARVAVLPERAVTEEEIHLPVVARNQLDNGISKNLWYEELVPHEAVFYFAVLSNNQSSGDQALEDFDQALGQHPLVQFGGNASIGCGLARLASY